MKSLLRIFLLLSIVLAGASAFGQASDNNSGLCPVAGTPPGCTGPWHTIKHAIAAAQIGPGGTVIHVAPGTYSEAAPCAGNTPVICVNRGGTSATARLVIKCDAQWSVPSSSGCLLRNNGGTNGAVEITANYVDVGAINGFGFDYSNAAAGFGVFDHCVPNGTACTGGNSVHILGNYMHDIGQTIVDGNGGLGCPSAGGILGGPSTHGTGATMTDFQVIGNRVSNFGLQSRAPRNGGNCNFAHGLYISNANSVLEDNVIIQAIVYGIQFYSAPCGSVISNNTIDQAGKGNIVIGGGDCPTPGKITINNNIFESAPSGGVTLGAGGTSPCTSTSRVKISNNVVPSGTAITNGNLNGCTDVSGTVTEAPTTTFTGYSGSSANNSYVLKVGSAAIKGGTTGCVNGGIIPCIPPITFTGAGQPSPPDIGAY